MKGLQEAATIDAIELTQRLVGFVAHLRLNEFALGPEETRAALELTKHIDVCTPHDTRIGFKTLLAGRREEWERFDALFEAYWYGRGKVRERSIPSNEHSATSSRPKLWQDHLPDAADSQFPAPQALAGGDEERNAEKGDSRLAASKRALISKTDLRHIVDPHELADAEKLAGHLACAMRYRLSRRTRISKQRRRLDLRRSVRRNLCRGGEPIELVWRRRPDRPVRIVVLLDVSGSMQQYSRFFLQFVKGLVGAWAEADAYLFHTQLVRVTSALRDQDPIRAMAKVALMVQGIGGGTRIGASLRTFNDQYAKATLNSRSVVVILSDGYDTGEVSNLIRELQRLRCKARRIVWLNPLLGWEGYEPVARAMAAALPYIDYFAPAHSLEALAALEGEFARL